MKKSDMDVLEFARKISMLSIDTPLAKEFDDAYGQKMIDGGVVKENI